VRSEAAERRRSFRHALGCFLDLVAVRLAGGAGVDSALAGSAVAGDGWAFAELRQALTDARLRGEPSWIGLAHLGEELGISELQELAASAGLAGDEGARVRVSITAKARAIRMRGLADAESAAQSASERMSLPVVLLMTGFIVFLGYPAVAAVLTGL
jgi:Flp pilus assembly protein TadB